MDTKQKELTVWMDGKEWTTFPEGNLANMEELLIRKGLSARCVILPKGERPIMGKVTVLSPETKSPEQPPTPPKTTTRKKR